MRWAWVLGLTGRALAALAQDSDALAQDSASSWWERPLLDFSTDAASVLVNPFMDLAVGSAGGQIFFENTRGARFDAEVDTVWRVEGALEERQGAADPVLTAWAFATANKQAGTVALPGWGRAKWTDRTNYLEGTPLQFDASRAVVRMERSWERVAVASGLDNLHEGLGLQSAFWSRHAAPLPFIGAAYTGQRWRVGGWAGAAVGSERGPAGATAESLYARQRATRLGVGIHRNADWSADLLWLRLAEVPFNPATSDPAPARHWGGAQFHVRRGPWLAYAALAVDWRAALSAAPGPAYMGELVHIRWSRRRTEAVAEWHRSRTGSLRDAPASGAPHLSLLHSGTPLTHLWGDGWASATLRMNHHVASRWAVHAAATAHVQLASAAELPAQNAWNTAPLAEAQVFVSRVLLPAWPLVLFGGVRGIRGVPALPDLSESTWIATWCVGLSHKFHSAACQSGGALP